MRCHSLVDAVFNPISNGSFGDIRGFQNAELCYPMEKNVALKLTNEQVYVQIVCILSHDQLTFYMYVPKSAWNVGEVLS